MENNEINKILTNCVDAINKNELLISQKKSIKILNDTILFRRNIWTCHSLKRLLYIIEAHGLYATIRSSKTIIITIN